MKFLKFAENLKKLEETTKRNQMIKILAELFEESSKGEIDKIMYLCQSQLGPSYQKIEFGLGEKLIEKVIAKGSSLSKEEVEEKYSDMGDLGLVAEEVINEKHKKLEIKETYERLKKIAEVNGKGSMEKKVLWTSQLVRDLDPLSSKYVLRIILGQLRVGIGEPTLMDGLSWMKKEDKSLREPLERAYNLCSDLGYVARKFMKEGIEEVKKINIEVGRPIRMALAERLSSSKEVIDKIGRCSAEPKYDGFRCQIHKRGNEVKIFSRNLEDNTNMFPEIVEGTRKEINAEEAIFEGEAVAYNESADEYYPFQVTVQRKRKYKIDKMKEKYPLKLFTFDLLYKDGRDLTKKDYEKRRKELDETIKNQKTLKLTENKTVKDPDRLKKFFEREVEKGQEGLLCKRLDAPYSAGARNYNWIKLKRSYKGGLSDTIDCVIIGYFKGKGARAEFGIGALLAAVYDKEEDKFETIAKIGSGLTEDQWVKMRKKLDKISKEKKPSRVNSEIEPDVWVVPKIVVEVRADEITRSPVHTCGKKKEGESGYALRFPRVVNFVREDKGPQDANSVKEVKEMFEMQN